MNGYIATRRKAVYASDGAWLVVVVGWWLVVGWLVVAMTLLA